MNTVKIFYESIKGGAKEELLSVEAEFLPIKEFYWWKERKVIIFMWEHPHIEAARALLKCADQILEGTRVVICNETANKAQDDAQEARNDERETNPIETLLQQYFGKAILDEFDFSNKSDVEHFCNRYSIEDEMLKLAIEFSYASESEEELIRKLMASTGQKYSEVAKELRKATKKWLNTFYPDLVSKHPEWEVKNFLNLFREKRF